MIRSLYRRLVPDRHRAAIRRFRMEVPIRVRDLLPDLRDGQRDTPPLPPARLRERVGTDSSREQFLSVGLMTAGLVRQSFDAQRESDSDYPTWVDFGCGSGRIARHLLDHPAVASLVGLDVDSDAIQWCEANLEGRFIEVSPKPPTPIDAGAADVVYCISVFTHLDEPAQFAWLEEVRRMLRHGGLFVVSTHPPALTYNRPDLDPAAHRELEERGFLFASGTGAFNDDSAFHSVEYLRQTWSKWFDLLDHQPGALGSVQDLSVWRAG